MKKSEIQEITREVHAVERGEIAPARVREVTLLPSGAMRRVELDPETYRRKQARAWKAKTEAAKVRHELDLTQEDFATMLASPSPPFANGNAAPANPAAQRRPCLRWQGCIRRRSGRRWRLGDRYLNRNPTAIRLRRGVFRGSGSSRRRTCFWRTRVSTAAFEQIPGSRVVPQSSELVLCGHQVRCGASRGNSDKLASYR